MENFILIQLKDICYYDDNFEYEPIVVKKDKDFEKKYKRFVKVCKTYENFFEVEDFIEQNFERVKIELRTIEI